MQSLIREIASVATLGLFLSAMFIWADILNALA